MTARLEQEIDAQPDEPSALPAAEATTRAEQLINQIDALERQEEALIIAVEAQGGSILRRADAAPAAVLGVRLVTTQAKKKAA